MMVKHTESEIIVGMPSKFHENRYRVFDQHLHNLTNIGPKWELQSSTK